MVLNNVFKKENTVELKKEVFHQLRKHCSRYGLSVSQFVEEAIIEKIVKNDLK